ncbi:MAG: hypothetical protein EA376_00125 [Phycisphaeraceae bacterium]|nr:MAG: hypothetical protein EA376_00125 [Phycisphaeraceae bacterium]
MAFTGKATYSAGADLPEIAEDVSDIIGIVSPFETALLDHLGDPRRPARSTVHEWLEDELLPNRDAIDQSVFSPSPEAATAITVLNGSFFEVGDQVRPQGTREVMLVTAISGDTLTVARGYGGTAPAELEDGQGLIIIGGAALEGAEKPDVRFTNRVRRANFTQIFTKTVEVSGSQLAAQAIGVADELDYQKQERMRELLRDLENCVINGVAPESSPQGGASVRRTMKGIISHITTNRFEPATGPIPPGDGFNTNLLNEAVLNGALRAIWENSSAQIDTIVVNGAQKRRINEFIGDSRAYSSRETNFRDLVSTYASDFGVARVVLSRWVPSDCVLLLDSSRIEVMPLAGRSFHFKPLASGGDSEIGQVIGEYTLEMRNEAAHGLIEGLALAA